MRAAVLSLLFTVSLAAPAMAQVTYGARGGVSFANVSFEAEAEAPSSGRAGVLAGLFATIPVAGRVAVQPEVIYTVKGASLDIDGFVSDYIVDYLEVPVLARLRLSRRVYVVAGPAMGFRLRARSRVAFGGSTEEFDLKEDVTPFDLGIVGGAGVGFGRWIVDARYTHGVRDIDADTTDDVRIRNRVVSLTAGIRF